MMGKWSSELREFAVTMWSTSTSTSEISNLDPTVKLILVLFAVAAMVIAFFVEILRRKASNDTSPDFFGAVSARETMVFLIGFAIVFSLIRILNNYYISTFPSAPLGLLAGALSLKIYKKFK